MSDITINSNIDKAKELMLVREAVQKANIKELRDAFMTLYVYTHFNKNKDDKG